MPRVLSPANPSADSPLAAAPRAIITQVTPQVEHGRWPVKRSVGEQLAVTAGVVVDGHEALAVELVHRAPGGAEHVQRMTAQGNDEYTATVEIEALGMHTYAVRAWLDRFATWQDQFQRRVDGGESPALIESELKAGTALVREAAKQAKKADKKTLNAHADAFEKGDTERALDASIAPLVRRHAPRAGLAESKTLELWADPEVARFGAWYEFFPRSTRDDPGSESGAGSQHGTLDDAAARLPRIAEMGYDIVYLPPVHPIGMTHRKGKDNAPTAEEGEPGSPWAIGGTLEDGTKGGHKSVAPELGGLEAFDRFVKKAEELGLKVALDIAYQTSPDHPYVEEHPEWFYQRPDGTIRYAENPPKKYQDVYPLKFEGNEDLWEELKGVFEFWIARGVTTFRVDNPHTKPFAFWEWCIGSLREEHPELIFLAEAFTKPKTMYLLAKLGFNQSYTYFTWRNTKEELQEYGRELFQTEVADFYRPNFWPNTPDILHDYLVQGGRPAHIARFVLAGTLAPAIGVYGPPFEHVDNQQHPDREEYANNEKYEVRTWNWNDPDSLQPLMQRVNEIRRGNAALQHPRSLRFVETQNDHLIAYTRRSPSGNNVICTVVNLDPHAEQTGWTNLPLEALGLPADASFTAHDLLTGERYTWRGAHNYVRLSPQMPAHILRLEYSDASGQDFEAVD